MTLASEIKKGNIDKNILPLVRELNRVGLETIWSCGGHRDFNKCAYVMVKLKKGTEFMVNDEGFTFYWDFKQTKGGE